MPTLETFLLSNKRAATPLVALSTPDQPRTERDAVGILKGKQAWPLVRWTCLDGYEPLNKAGEEATAAMVPQGQDPSVTRDLTAALVGARSAPDGTCILYWNAHRFLESAEVMQGLMSLRDICCPKNVTLILLGPGFENLPSEIAQDVDPYRVSLPDRAALTVACAQIYTDALAAYPKLPKWDDLLAAKIVDAVQGLPTFGAESSLSTSVGPKGLDWSTLWAKKAERVNATLGLRFEFSEDKALGYASVAGYDAFKARMTAIFRSRKAPTLVVIVEEIDKVFSRALAQGGDGDPTSPAILKCFLTTLDTGREAKVCGLLNGIPGAAKSAMAAATAVEFGIPLIRLDPSAAKRSLVGETERNIQKCFDTIEACSGGKAIFLATANGVAGLKDELRRRLRNLGQEWFFDIPTPEERAKIWALYVEKFGLAKQPLPEDTDWTGADVRTCCEAASVLGLTLVDAGASIVPIAISGKARVEALRAEAVNAFTDPTTGRRYTGPANQKKEPPADRKRQFKSENN